MSFDLEAHLKNHAEHFEKFREISPKSMHFNFSFLDLQFIGKDKKQVMYDLLKEIKKPMTYREPNGWRDGKQLFANRTIDLGKSTEVEAIHFKDPEGLDTMPHIHLIEAEGTRLGKGFSTLRKHISIISEKYGLTPNFDEISEHNPMSVKKLAKAVNTLTWSWKKMTNTELRKDIDTRGLDNAIDILEAYALKTNNLTYYVKSMEGLKTRLNRLKLDVEYQGHNLRNTYPIPLKEDDLTVVKLIAEKKFNQKDMKPHLKNHILRDFIRHSTGTSKPFIINTLKEQTTLLDGMRKNQKAVENYVKLSAREPQLKKSQLTKPQNRSLSIKNDLGVNLRLAAQSVSNEKELRSIMQEAGYQDFGLKKLRGSVKGCFYFENDKKQEFKFIDINVNWSEIKRDLMTNARKQENGVQVEKKELHKCDLKPFDDLAQPKPLVKKPKTVEIEYRAKEIKKEKEKQKEKSRARRFADEFINRTRNGIRELKNQINEFKNSSREKIDRLTREFVEVKKEITSIEERLLNAVGLGGRIEEAKIKNAHLEQRIENRRGGISRGAEDIRLLQEEIGRIEYLSEDELEERIRDTTIENTHLKTRVEELRGNVGKVVAHRQQLKEPNKRMRETPKRRKPPRP